MKKLMIPLAVFAVAALTIGPVIADGEEKVDPPSCAYTVGTVLRDPKVQAGAAAGTAAAGGGPAAPFVPFVMSLLSNGILAFDSFWQRRKKTQAVKVADAQMVAIEHFKKGLDDEKDAETFENHIHELTELAGVDTILHGWLVERGFAKARK